MVAFTFGSTSAPAAQATAPASPFNFSASSVLIKNSVSRNTLILNVSTGLMIRATLTVEQSGDHEASCDMHSIGYCFQSPRHGQLSAPVREFEFPLHEIMYQQTYGTNYCPMRTCVELQQTFYSTNSKGHIAVTTEAKFQKALKSSLNKLTPNSQGERLYRDPQLNMMVHNYQIQSTPEIAQKEMLDRPYDLKHQNHLQQFFDLNFALTTPLCTELNTVQMLQHENLKYVAAGFQPLLTAARLQSESRAQVAAAAAVAATASNKKSATSRAAHRVLNYCSKLLSNDNDKRAQWFIKNHLLHLRDVARCNACRM